MKTTNLWVFHLSQTSFLLMFVFCKEVLLVHVHAGVMTVDVDARINVDVGGTAEGIGAKTEIESVGILIAGVDAMTDVSVAGIVGGIGAKKEVGTAGILIAGVDAMTEVSVTGIVGGKGAKKKVGTAGILIAGVDADTKVGVGGVVAGIGVSQGPKRDNSKSIYISIGQSSAFQTSHFFLCDRCMSLR